MSPARDQAPGEREKADHQIEYQALTEITGKQNKTMAVDQPLRTEAQLWHWRQGELYPELLLQQG